MLVFIPSGWDWLLFPISAIVVCAMLLLFGFCGGIILAFQRRNAVWFLVSLASVFAASQSGWYVLKHFNPGH